jgi:RNA polymerase sigma-70 factor (ECF subfamily)
MSDTNANPERHAEFVRLLNSAHRRLLAYLVSLLGNRHDAEDVLQRSSMTMWRKFDAFETGTEKLTDQGVAKFLAWASTVAFYEVKNFQRAAYRSRLYFNDELMQLMADERMGDLKNTDSRIEALDHCLAKLDAPGLQLVEAAYLTEGSLTQFAEKLGRAPQTLYNKLNAIRRLLADCVTRRLAES